MASKRPAPSFAKQFELAATRLAFRAPPGVLVKLSGKPPVVVAGQPLHPEMQFLLAARRLLGRKGLRADTVESARRRMRAESDRYSAAGAEVRSVTDLSVEGAAGPLAARHYAPDESGGPHPLLVFFHGGGFSVGDLETHDNPCRLLCRHAGVHVLSIEYRLAPEHPFPAAFEDAWAAFLWASERASTLGADPSRIGVGGDSAGGNLAAGVALHAVSAREAAPSFQLLIYPATDRATRHPSMDLFAERFFLETADMEWFDANYMGSQPDVRRDVRMSPLLAESLSGVCRAHVVTGGFDPLRDEGEAYARALQAVGTPVTLKREDGLIHGFINMADVSPVALRAVKDMAEATRRLARA